MGILHFTFSVLKGLTVGVTLLDTVGYVAKVEGISMQPTLNPDTTHSDCVFLSRWAVRTQDIQRGEIVAIICPKKPNQILIKRVIAISGDIVDTHGYRLNIVKIPKGHCWVEGDHTGHSMDSNNFGPVSIGLITAKATCIVWPPNRWQYLNSFMSKRNFPLSISRQERLNKS